MAACAEAGTDYADLTGEPEFVDLMYVRHHARAVETGARIVHACGFDSIPHDLGALFTVEQLPEGVPLDRRGLRAAGGKPSRRHLPLRDHRASRAAAAEQGGRRERKRLRAARRGPAGRAAPRPSPHRDRRRRRLGAAAAHDRPAGRPAAPRRALDRYGPDFTYGHFAAVKHLPVARRRGWPAVRGAVRAGADPAGAQVAAGPDRVGRRASPEEREKGWFNVTFVGEGGGQKVITEVSGGDPGYGETAKMLAESALCLAHDELPETAGQVTTAAGDGAAADRASRAAGHRVPNAFYA